MLDNSDLWNYPALTKPMPNDTYYYPAQRRLSVYFSIQLERHLWPNAGTGLYLIFGLTTAALVLPDHWLWGAVFVQMFGLVFNHVGTENSAES